MLLKYASVTLAQSEELTQSKIIGYRQKLESVSYTRCVVQTKNRSCFFFGVFASSSSDVALALYIFGEFV